MSRIDDCNYFNDRRVTCSEDRWWHHIDEKSMTAQVNVFDNETEEEVEKTVRFHYDVCPVCDGRGSHVNPSIDSNGLTAEDFAEDPDFAEEYCSGKYDVPCNLCGGKRIVPVCDDEEVNKRIAEDQQFKALCRAEYLAELRAGA